MCKTIITNDNKQNSPLLMNTQNNLYTTACLRDRRKGGALRQTTMNKPNKLIKDNKV